MGAPNIATFVEGVTAFDGLKESVGLALAVSFVFNIVMLWLFFGERRERRSSWRSYNSLLQNNISVLGKLETSIAILITMQTQSRPRRQRAPLPDKDGGTHE